MNLKTLLVDHHGQAALDLRAPDGARARVLLHGGHVVSWRPAGGAEQLYLSPDSGYGLGASVRGGIPIIFPQFANQGPGPRHGVARTRAWELVQHDVSPHDALAVLRLVDDADTRAAWPHAFALELTVRIQGAELDLELAVENTGDTAFDFQAALHSYWQLQSLRHTVLEGLQDCGYVDSARGGAEGVQHSGRLEMLGNSVVDRIVKDIPGVLKVIELAEAPARKLGLGIEGFTDAVVWNPGPNHGLADLPADDWQRFVCLEAAQVTSPVYLPAGDTWVARQTARLL